MSKEEILAEMLEVQRRLQKMREEYGEEAFNRILASSPEAQLLRSSIEDLIAGRITEDQAQRDQELVDRSLRNAASKADA
jgi:hypothetical protein